MSNIVIIGGSFGGITTAMQLKRLLGHNHTITVISDNDNFVFLPSLHWVALGWRSAKDITVDLKKLLPSKKINFMHSPAKFIDTDKQSVITDKGIVPYDYLVIATGPHLDFKAIPGLGPEKGYTESIFTLGHAEKAYLSWQKYLETGGPIVIGATQGVSCFGPAYELILDIDHQLRKLGKRSKTSLSFVTSEPYLSHFGLGGVGKSRRMMEDEFAERDIKVVCNAVIEKFLPGRVKLMDKTELPYNFAMFAPPFRGVDVVVDSALGNPKGWLSVDEYYRHRKYQNIYGVGVALELNPPESTPIPTGVPKTGSMTCAVAKIVAKNIKCDIKGGTKVSLPFNEVGVTCCVDMGNTAALMAAKPALPPRQTIFLKKKFWVRWMKFAFERYFISKTKAGASYLP
ncbi:FAD-dependent oxidoreductase [Desulfotomaculum defluvii]